MVQTTFLKLAGPSLTEMEPYAPASELRFERLPVKTQLVLFWFALSINDNFPSLPLWTPQVSVNGFSAADRQLCSKLKRYLQSFFLNRELV